MHYYICSVLHKQAEEKEKKETMGGVCICVCPCFWLHCGDTTYSAMSTNVLSVTLHKLKGSQQQSGDNLVCHGADGRVLGGSCFFVGMPPEKPVILTCWSCNMKRLSAPPLLHLSPVTQTTTKRWYREEKACEMYSTMKQCYVCYIPRNLATNQLGSATSDITTLDRVLVRPVTTDPPANVQVNRVGDLDDQLLVCWASSRELKDILFQAKYQIHWTGGQPWQCLFIQPPSLLLFSPLPPSLLSELLQSSSCDLKPGEQNSTLRRELKQFFGWVRKHAYGYSGVSTVRSVKGVVAQISQSMEPAR
uniref:Uncharacterized protein n=1 Tax=Monopterus albus TaxID=43700 RepID=A0A3Q3JAV6_MONAL